MNRNGRRVRHSPDECSCQCHQGPLKTECHCCWPCPYCRLRIKRRIKPDSHASRCERLIWTREQKMDPTLCVVTDPPKPRDHPAGCCRPCDKCGRFITAELIDEHKGKFCPINTEDDEPDVA